VESGRLPLAGMDSNEADRTPTGAPHPGVVEVELRWTTELTAADHTELAVLFDGVYAADWGPWNARTGYGYATAELHALARENGVLVGYAATGRRFVSVGGSEVVISGLGGVITRDRNRGQGVGRRVVGALMQAGTGSAAADFGYVGCRPEVVPFYRSCGFSPVHNVVRELSTADAATVVESQGPTLIHAGTRTVDQWPDGVVDLRGLPW